MLFFDYTTLSSNADVPFGWVGNNVYLNFSVLDGKNLRT